MFNATPRYQGTIPGNQCIHKDNFKKIILLRNGNLEFHGSFMIVSDRKYPDFDCFLRDLNSLKISKLADSRANGKMGTKYIFTTSGCRVNSLDQMKNGEAYVCCASNMFARLDYAEVIKKKLDDPGFTDAHLSEFKISSTMNRNQIFDLPFQPPLTQSHNIPPYMHQCYNYPAPLNKQDAKMTQIVQENSKLVVSILAGNKRPRNISCVTYDIKLINSINQVVKLIAQSLNISYNCIRELFTPDGKPVMNLGNLTEDINVVLVNANKQSNKNQFEYTGQEMQLMCSSIAKSSRFNPMSRRLSLKSVPSNNITTDHISCIGKESNPAIYKWVELKYNKNIFTEENDINKKQSAMKNSSISEKENSKLN